MMPALFPNVKPSLCGGEHARVDDHRDPKQPGTVWLHAVSAGRTTGSWWHQLDGQGHRDGRLLASPSSFAELRAEAHQLTIIVTELLVATCSGDASVTSYLIACKNTVAPASA